MSDANIDAQASELYGLTTGDGFYPQNSSDTRTSDEAIVFGATGKLACHNEFNKGNEYTNTYRYCGTDLVNDLGTLATAFGGVTGTGATAIIWTGLELSFSSGEQAEVTISGHLHDDNNHDPATNTPRTFNISSLIPSGAGVGVPIPYHPDVVGSDASPSGCSMSFAVEHIDKLAADGGHFAGENVNCRCDVTMDFEGICQAESTVGTPWKQPLRTQSDDNQDLDTSSMSAHTWVDHS